MKLICRSLMHQEVLMLFRRHIRLKLYTYIAKQYRANLDIRDLNRKP